MIKSILVASGGSSSDRALFATALAAARPFGAHLEVLHMRPDPGTAALYAPHVEFAQGAALSTAMLHLKEEARSRSAAASSHFRDFCYRESIAIAQAPSDAPGVSAHWREETWSGLDRLLTAARHSDLVIAGRHTRANGLPPDLLEQLLIGTGRPLLVPAAAPSRPLTGTLMVCWKETPEAARALGAAMPFLVKASRVVLVGVAETGGASADDLQDLAGKLAWHGVRAEPCFVPRGEQLVAAALLSFAAALEAELLVMGGYGRSRTRELVFGGCTRALLDACGVPVLLLH